MDFYLIFGLPLAIFGLLRLTLPNVRFDFDFDQTHATFFFVLDRLARIAWMIFGFGMVGAFAFRRAVGPGEAPVILLAASIYALMFILWMTLQYESYLHSRYPKDGGMSTSNYTVTKYAITSALGVSGFLFFIAGAVMAMRSM